MRKPQFITFTGADDHTDIAGMQRLSKLYPIEWGILFSPDRGRAGRHPKPPTIGKFMDANLRLAAHLCGPYASQMISTGDCILSTILHGSFERVQINGHFDTLSYEPLLDWSQRRALPIILQCRGEFPNEDRLAWLFDRPGGDHQFSALWSEPKDKRTVGYAGGIHLHNVAGVVDQLSRIADHYWIDVEDGVRDKYDYFSLDLCQKICETVYGASPYDKPTHSNVLPAIEAHETRGSGDAFDAARLIAAELRDRLAPGSIPAMDYNWLIQKVTAAIEKESLEVKTAEKEVKTPDFTPRELQVMKLLTLGYSNKEIARSLGMLEGTVKVHVKSIMKKTGTNNRTQVAIAGNRMMSEKKA